MAQWAGLCLTNGEVAGSISGQGTCLVVGQSPVGGVRELMEPCFSHTLLFPSLPSFFSKNK